MFFWDLLLDMVSLGTQQLRAGLGISFCCKVPHVKHPIVHAVALESLRESSNIAETTTFVVGLFVTQHICTISIFANM